MKTQGAVLKQCISILGAIFLEISIPSHAFGYSSLSPWVNGEGVSSGFQFEPLLGLRSTQDLPPDFRLSANGAISNTANIYGNYGSQSDRRLGVHGFLNQTQAQAFSVQGEASLDPGQSPSFTVGAFEQVSFLEFGAGLNYIPSSETSLVPLSLSSLHHFSNGFAAGGALRGELGPSDDYNWFSFQLLAHYQPSASLRYDLSFAIPVTAKIPANDYALEFGFALSFGANSSNGDAIQSKHYISENENLHYNLAANIIASNEALFLLKIDKGTNDSVAKGQTFDIYTGDRFLARAQVVAVKVDEAALSVIEYKEEQWIELGYSARRLSGE